MAVSVAGNFVTVMHAACLLIDEPVAETLFLTNDVQLCPILCADLPFLLLSKTFNSDASVQQVQVELQCTSVFRRHQFHRFNQTRLNSTCMCDLASPK